MAEEAITDVALLLKELELSKKREQEAKEIARKAKEGERKAKEGERKANEKLQEITRSLLDGLPELGSKKGSTSDATENLEHTKALLEVKFFSQLEIKRPVEPKVSIIWTKYRAGALSFWDSEHDIQSLVSDVLRDAIVIVGLESALHCFHELSIFALRPDIWVIQTSWGLPVGVVEINKPDDKIMESKLVHGQIYDYMLWLRSFYGLKNVFGLVSTYESWRIYWLPDTDEVAQATSLPTQELNPSSNKEKNQYLLNEEPVNSEDEEPVDQEEETVAETEIPSSQYSMIDSSYTGELCMEAMCTNSPTKSCLPFFAVLS